MPGGQFNHHHHHPPPRPRRWSEVRVVDFPFHANGQFVARFAIHRHPVTGLRSVPAFSRKLSIAAPLCIIFSIDTPLLSARGCSLFPRYIRGPFATANSLVKRHRTQQRAPFAPPSSRLDENISDEILEMTMESKSTTPMGNRSCLDNRQWTNEFPYPGESGSTIKGNESLERDDCSRVQVAAKMWSQIAKVAPSLSHGPRRLQALSRDSYTLHWHSYWSSIREEREREMHALHAHGEPLMIRGILREPDI
jgi:hypothetical protein